MKSKTSRRHKRKSCRGKIRYKTKDGAHIAMHVQRRRKDIFGFRELEVYKCPFCKGWHVGRTAKVNYRAFDKLK